MTPRRSLVVAVGCALAIAAIGFLGGYGVPSPPSSAFLSRYEARMEGLSFTYPATWIAPNYPEFVGSFSTVIVYLSNQLTHPPCSDGSCGFPVTRLNPGGIVAWWVAGGGRPIFNATIGTPMTVSGRPAKLSTELTSTCSSIGGDAQMQVIIKYPGDADHWYAFGACIRGPGEQALESQVMALLASTTLAPSPG